jgi:hypothetical protein
MTITIVMHYCSFSPHPFVLFMTWLMDEITAFFLPPCTTIYAHRCNK